MEEKYKIIENEHDKVFKELFNISKEAVHIINTALELRLKENEIERYTNSFITSNYKYKEADCVYKKKDEKIFFVLEHQSVIDFRMPYRMLNYQTEVMRSCENYKNTKENKEALVIGIVLYTGRPEWKAELYIRNIQYKLDDGMKTVLGDNKTLGNYTVIDINKFTKEELLREEGIISKVMLIEKSRRTEDLGRILIEAANYLDREGVKYIKNLIKNILVKDIGNKEAKKVLDFYKNIINKKGSEEKMELAVSRMIRNEINGKVKRGEKLGRINVAKNLLVMGYEVDEVGRITELSVEEIRKLKNRSM